MCAGDRAGAPSTTVAGQTLDASWLRSPRKGCGLLAHFGAEVFASLVLLQEDRLAAALWALKARSLRCSGPCRLTLAQGGHHAFSSECLPHPSVFLYLGSGQPMGCLVKG